MHKVSLLSILFVFRYLRFVLWFFNHLRRSMTVARFLSYQDVWKRHLYRYCSLLNGNYGEQVSTITYDYFFSLECLVQHRVHVLAEFFGCHYFHSVMLFELKMYSNPLKGCFSQSFRGFTHIYRVHPLTFTVLFIHSLKIGSLMYNRSPSLSINSLDIKDFFNPLYVGGCLEMVFPYDLVSCQACLHTVRKGYKEV